MRDRKLAQVNRNIEYLEVQIDKTAIADMRGVFQVIEEQIKNKMLAEAAQNMPLPRSVGQCSRENHNPNEH